MGRYLRSLRIFWGTALAIQLEYQVNVLIELLAMLASITGSIFLLSLFFNQGNQLGGWSWEAALIVQGIYTLFDGLTNTWLRPNLGAIVNYVREGTLDFVLLKPIDSQFWLSVRTLSPSGIPEVILGFTLISWAAPRAGAEFNLGLFFVAGLMLLFGTVILYSLWFLIASTTIWFVKTWNATEVLRALLAAGRFPIIAYPPTLRFIFTFILPVAFLTTVPAEVILGRASIHMLFLSLLVAIISFTLSRCFWLYALRHYTSASS